ncbi:hypothetical protein BGZ60DRAFT_372511 [Tricladium varicosporioides]|nr:hypothetical protein BGZ60DRAFT_372511 [Hymenoscyphus varicosporioides]
MTDLELLVHTSAPSRGQDDARYRALARAYLDFTPHTHHSLSEPPQTLPTIIREIDDTSTQSHGYTKVISQDQASWVSYHPNEDDQSESALSSVSHHYQPHSQEEVPQTYTSSQLSFGSAIDNADSPPFQHRVTCNQRFLTDPQGSQEQNSSDSYHPPPSTIADSQPSYQRGLTAASSPTRMLEVYHQFIDSSQESPTAQTLLSVAHDNHASTNNQDLHLDPRSSLQELITGISSDSANQQTLPTLRSIGLRQTPSSSLESRDPSNSTSPLVQRFLRSTRKSFAMASSSPLNTENVSMVSASAPAVLQASPPQDQQTEYDLSTAIYVVPATSNAHLESHMLITEGLHSLAAKMPLSTYFKPLKQTRELEEMERGHWLLKCDSWSQELRRRCWNCIGNFLIQERAGWTVGLTRNDDFGLMKVFCWSNTVPYVYLLIYIASEGKVKKIGATWMDGGSNVIITMPP